MQLQIRQAKRASVQDFPKYRERTPPILMQVAIAADEAPSWWTEERDNYLRLFWRGEPFLASAIYSLCSRNAGFRWEIESADPVAKAMSTNLLNTAEFGEGWQELVLKVSEDIYTQDNGGFIEVVRPARARVNGKDYRAIAQKHKSGDIDWYAISNRAGAVKQVEPEAVSDSPLDLPIGLAHLDASKCTRTGDPDIPVVYMDRYGKEHDLRPWQVVTLNDMPTPIEEMHNVGFCMVSRVFRSAQTVRDWIIYREEKISGRFARAVHLTNVDSEVISDAIAQAHARADAQGLYRYSQPIITNTLDPNARPWNVTIPLAELPEGWNEDEMMRWYIALVALAAGEHYSFMAPMPGRRLGSAREVEVQERQARGKSSRLFMEQIVAKFNNAGIFPPTCKLVFKEKDPEEQAANEEAALRRADTRSLRIASGEITPQVARQIALDQGDLREEYLRMMGEADVTPADAGPQLSEEPAGVPAPLDIPEQVTFGEKQEAGEPPEPWGDKAVPISKDDVARAIAKWDRRMPPEAEGLLQAREPTEEEEDELAEAETKETSRGPGYWRPHYGRPGRIGGSRPRQPGLVDMEAQVRLPFSDAVESGDTESWRDLGGGISDTKLVSYKGDGKGVWKIEQVDTRIVGIADLEGVQHNQANNAVAAYNISRLLSGDEPEITPEVVFGELGGKQGTVQYYIENARPVKALSHEERLEIFQDPNNRRRVEMILGLDMIMQNRDRHLGNALITDDGVLFGIDHDLSLLSSSREMRYYGMGLGPNQLFRLAWKSGYAPETFFMDERRSYRWRMSDDLHERWSKITFEDMRKAIPRYPDAVAYRLYDNLQVLLRRRGVQPDPWRRG
jgi:hypothetical protein